MAGEIEEPVFHRKPNPLPRTQLVNALLINLCSSLSQLSILPFISEFVSGLEIIGGDKRKVGFYVGLSESIYNVSTAITLLQWSRLSDKIGRKPILLITVAAVAICMPFLGLSRTFLGLVASRCLLGLLNSSNGVLGSVFGEITDSTNRAKGMAWCLVSWSAGGSIGALIGGSLSNPSRHFPGLFKGDFWKYYPYFLPCFVIGIFAIVSFLSVLITFEETVVEPSLLSSHRSHDEHSTLLPSDADETYSVRQLLAYPSVMISIVNHMSFNFLFTCLGALVPVFFAMPSDIGGLGFDPVDIGYILGGYRAFMVLFVLICSPRIIRRWGERFTFIIAIFSCMSIWTLMLLTNLCARSFGVSMLVWVGVVIITLPFSLMETGSVCAFIYVTAAAPTRTSLGTMNGMAWTVTTITQSVAPATATSLFSFSAKHNFLGGYTVYAVLLTLSCVALSLALRLPDNPRPMWDVEGDSVNLYEGG